MEKAIRFEKPSEVRTAVGKEICVTDWVTVDQQRIDKFAEATGDFQWIHVDVERAKASPYGGTIAHGFLTLSLVSTLMREAIRIGGLRMAINYGINRVRFISAVPSGTRIRGRFTPSAVEPAGGAVQVTWTVTVEREASEKPCMVAEWLVRYYPHA
jgi:acyl dehydratase